MVDIPGQGIFENCWSEDEASTDRHKGKRALRAERAKGLGPPYIKDGKHIWYPIEAGREWAASQTRMPVRETPPQRPAHLTIRKPAKRADAVKRGALIPA